MATSAAPQRWTRLVTAGRIDGRMLLGVALVAVSIIGGLLLWGSASNTTAVVVASKDLPQGHVIAAGDLSTTQLRPQGGLSLLVIPQAEVSSLVGRTLDTRVVAGEPVIRPDLSTGPVIGPGEVAITIPVNANGVYPGLRPGDAVTVLGTPGGSQAAGPTVTVLDRALVYDVSANRAATTIGSGGQATSGLSNVTLVVPSGSAEQVAHASVSWTVTLALLAPDATAAPGSQ
jgi:Flp pilus assembly protein CpaB